MPKNNIIIFKGMQYAENPRNPPSCDCIMYMSLWKNYKADFLCSFFHFNFFGTG